jgi:VIT1/CCC1 family predicted Fe2+/Mn2+ transporter
MPRDTGKAPSGRVTPKGGGGRYTPPVPKDVKVSPRWVPALMGAFLLLGGLVILLNYVNVLPGSVTNWYLLAGLALITAGFVTATQWR